MNPSKNLLRAAGLATAIFSCTAAQAAVITFNPESSVATVGDSLQVTLVGRDWTEGEDGTYGGGVSISWDASVLELVSYDTSVFAGDQSLAASGTTTTIDNGSGVLSNLAVNSLFTGVYDADFDIAVLTFNAIGLGQSALSAVLGQFDSGFANIWTDTADGVAAIEITPDFLDGSVSVVPIPGALYLLGSALLGMFGFARRRKA